MNNQTVLFLLSIFVILAIVETATVVQCNLGLKMYSVESGNAICAPLSPFKCIEACEWNTSCALTSHYTAFRGKRSYVSGMVLTNNTFLVQCCASLATIVQMKPQQEPICVWVPEVETVEQKGSVRFDPPLSSDEYIREILVDRKGTGQVIVKAQICKYSVQRTNCDRESMSPEESRFYSLLLLRLSRTKAFLYNGNKTTIKTDFGDSLRDDSPLSNFRSLAKHSPANTNPVASSQRTTIRNIATTVVGEAGGNMSDTGEKTVANSTEPATTAGVIAEANTSSNFANRNASVSGDLKWRMHKDQPMPNFPWKPDLSGSEHPPGRNAMASISPRSHHLHLPPRGRPSLSSIGISKTENLPLITAAASSTLQFTPHKAEIASTHRQLTAATSQRENLFRRKLWPISTNDTKELIASPNWPIRDYNLGLDGPLKHDEVRIESEDSTTKQGRWLTSRSVPTPSQELAIKGELEIRKLHDGDHQHTTSGGGSFGGSWKPVSNTDAFRQVEQQLSTREESWGYPPPNWSAVPTNSTLPKAPSFKIIPVSETQPFATHPRVIHRPYSSHRHASEGIIAKELNRDEMEREVYKSWRLHGLLDCCQAQAPGCKHLCSKDVSKEEIKKAITSQQCAPLQMTSVIQCFPRFYNTTSVSKCCAQPASIEVNELARTEATVLPTKAPTKLPEQCLSLCAPDFKLTFAHFACIDHISTIVECYRDLMR